MMQLKWPTILVPVLGGLAIIWCNNDRDAIAQSAPVKPARSVPPDFEHKDFSDIFFGDIKEAIQGPIPKFSRNDKSASSTNDNLKSPGKSSAYNGTVDNSIGLSETPRPSEKNSVTISSSTLEDAVKQTRQRLDKIVTTPVRFSSGGAKEARREFTFLAMLFRAIEHHPGNMRWKSSAGLASQRFAQTARNAKVASPQSYNDAKQRLLELSDLMNGTPLTNESNAVFNDRDGTDNPIDRTVLMQILEWIYRDNLAKSASPSDRSSARPDPQDIMLSYAELSILCAQTLASPGMPDIDDKSYAELAASLLDASIEVTKSLKEEKPDLTRAAIGKMDQTCSRCHDAYR